MVAIIWKQECKKKYPFNTSIFFQIVIQKCEWGLILSSSLLNQLGLKGSQKLWALASQLVASTAVCSSNDITTQGGNGDVSGVSRDRWSHYLAAMVMCRSEGLEGNKDWRNCWNFNCISGEYILFFYFIGTLYGQRYSDAWLLHHQGL